MFTIRVMLLYTCQIFQWVLYATYLVSTTPMSHIYRLAWVLPLPYTISTLSLLLFCYVACSMCSATHQLVLMKFIDDVNLCLVTDVTP